MEFATKFGFNTPFKVADLNTTTVSYKHELYPFVPHFPAGEDLRQLSPFHLRSAERVTDAAIWQDTNGIYFGSRNYKGLSAEDPRLRYDENAPGKVSTFGLRDSAGRQRVEIGSAVLRKHGVPTEMITGEYELNDLFLDGGIVPIQEWKEQIARLKRPIFDGKGSAYQFNNRIAQYLAATRYYVQERSLQTSERVRDLTLMSIGYSVVVFSNGRYHIDSDQYSSSGDILSLLPNFLDGRALRANVNMEGKNSEPFPISDLHDTLYNMQNQGDYLVLIPGLQLERNYKQMIRWINQKNILSTKKN